jgi:hemerythrin superfamily protein
MDALALLQKDHETVKKLFTRFESARGAKKAVADRIIFELSVHAAVEEQLFYPSLRAAAEAAGIEEADEQVLEALEEHRVAKLLLAELEGMDEDNERFEAKMSVLMESVKHHIKEEEGPLFRFARRLLPKSQRDLLGAAMQEAKKAAPTRPHPRAPDEPPGNLISGPVAAVIDRGRDLMRDFASQALARARKGSAAAAHPE